MKDPNFSSFARQRNTPKNSNEMFRPFSLLVTIGLLAAMSSCVFDKFTDKIVSSKSSEEIENSDFGNLNTNHSPFDYSQIKTK